MKLSNTSLMCMTFMDRGKVFLLISMGWKPISITFQYVLDYDLLCSFILILVF